MIFLCSLKKDQLIAFVAAFSLWDLFFDKVLLAQPWFCLALIKNHKYPKVNAAKSNTPSIQFHDVLNNSQTIHLVIHEHVSSSWQWLHWSSSRQQKRVGASDQGKIFYHKDFFLVFVGFLQYQQNNLASFCSIPVIVAFCFRRRDFRQVWDGLVATMLYGHQIDHQDLGHCCLDHNMALSNAWCAQKGSAGHKAVAGQIIPISSAILSAIETCF